MALLHGVSNGLNYLDGEAGVEGVLVTEGGEVFTTAGLDKLRADSRSRRRVAV